MTISSRTAEGQPLHCDVCGALVVVETSLDSGDATCPACGHLLWRVRNRLATELNLSEDDITLTAQLRDDLGATVRWMWSNFPRSQAPPGNASSDAPRPLRLPSPPH